jgi:hypothetical protein
VIMHSCSITAPHSAHVGHPLLMLLLLHCFCHCCCCCCCCATRLARDGLLWQTLLVLAGPCYAVAPAAAPLPLPLPPPLLMLLLLLKLLCPQPLRMHTAHKCKNVMLNIC